MRPRAYLLLALHAHLPYTRRPDLPAAMEESWLFEAITETYLPFLDMAGRLLAEGVPLKVTLSVSPTLLHMLGDPLLLGRYRAHMKRLIALAERETKRLADDPDLGPVASMYRDWFVQADDMFHGRYKADIPSAFAELAQNGSINLITTSATHGYLPLLNINPGSVKAQIKVAIEYFRKTFGFSPKGFWLPEMGYEPGMEKILADEGVGYFFLDAHGVLSAKPAPPAGTAAPIRAGRDISVFGRDLDSSRRIWHPKSGYPGNPSYRDFYRDQGYELGEEYLKDFLAPYGHRMMTGLKYHRITGGAGVKDVYDIAAGLAQAREDAMDFYHSRLAQAEATGDLDGAPPVFLAPFDAELFGHWWHEGPAFLEALIRLAARKESGLRLVTAEEYLALHPAVHEARPAASSWGEGGHSAMWLDPSNDWIYPPLHKAARRMGQLAQLYKSATGLMKRALDQAARELLLAQSSDWPFMMKVGAMGAYAAERARDHLANFNYLAGRIQEGNLDEGQLARLENAHPLFLDADFSIFAD